ncbi:hypothetical protein [Curtobacterium flaccumfaciens]|uniref:hypothetical protein n=1 Tax=Curtobacterium flaccumfaciens TaxID=2035 RepID=UPI0038792FDA
MPSADGSPSNPHELRLLLNHISGLWPGRTTITLDIDRTQPGDLFGWTREELELLISQGAQQLARQREDLERVRQRAQFTFTTALGAIVLIFLPVSVLFATPVGALLWFASAACLATGLLGSASVVVARKELPLMHAGLLSRSGPHEVRLRLAQAYASDLPRGENTVATEITVFRSSVFAMLLALSGLALATAWSSWTAVA